MFLIILYGIYVSVNSVYIDKKIVNGNDEEIE